MSTDYFEDHKIGAHIKAHRQSLGVLLSDLINAAGPASESMLRHAERAQRPNLDLVEYHHAALMTAYGNEGRTQAAILARREQWYTTAADTTLWHKALETNPAVSWWWGAVTATTPRGAWCYLCNHMIHGYDVGRGMTKRARKAVMAHRLQHITPMMTEHTTSKGTNTT